MGLVGGRRGMRTIWRCRDECYVVSSHTRSHAVLRLLRMAELCFVLIVLCFVMSEEEHRVHPYEMVGSGNIKLGQCYKTFDKSSLTLSPQPSPAPKLL